MKRKALCLLLILGLVLSGLPLDGSHAASYETGVINADGVAFRKGASSDSGRIRRLQKGTVVEILATNVNAEWHKVKYKSETGYVNRMYVDLKKAEDADASYRGTVVNCKENVNVRASANKDAELMGLADKGATFRVTRANLAGGWHEISYNGKTGYISADYLDLSREGASGQLLSLSVSGGTMSPAFSPDVYGYVINATSGDVRISAEGAKGAKVKIGDSGKSTVTVSMPRHGSKTVRISVDGKVKYSLYIVRGAITVGTWNIKRGNGKLTEMGCLVQAQQPDLMGVQEVYRCKSKTVVDNLLSLRTKEMQNTSFAKTVSYASGGEYGIGLLSAYKIESAETKTLSSDGNEQRVLQKIVVKIDGHRVSVYNTHFSYESAATRSKQFAEVKKWLDADTNKYKILFGDFNAKASEFSQLGKGYTALNAADTRFYDYGAGLMSKSEIDNIVVTDNITVLNIRMIDELLSDHRPIFAYLTLD